MKTNIPNNQYALDNTTSLIKKVQKYIIFMTSASHHGKFSYLCNKTHLQNINITISIVPSLTNWWPHICLCSIRVSMQIKALVSKGALPLPWLEIFAVLHTVRNNGNLILTAGTAELHAHSKFFALKIRMQRCMLYFRHIFSTFSLCQDRYTSVFKTLFGNDQAVVKIRVSNQTYMKIFLQIPYYNVYQASSMY